MKRRSLAFELTAYLGGAWLLLLLVLGGLLWQSAQRFIDEAHADKARALAAQLATISLDAVLLRDYGTLERYLADLAGTAGSLAYVEIRRADGRVLARTGERLAQAQPLRAPMRIRGADLDEEIGEVLAQYDPRPTRRTAWQIAGLLALALAVFAGLSFWALRRLLLDRLVAPVADLLEQADPERASPPIPSGAATEVAELAAAIANLRGRIDHHIAAAEEAAQSRNEALRRLCSEQRLAAVGQLAGEVAHELNTPLSNILGYAQSALPQAAEPALREALETIEAQARRAGQIVRDMLTAARAPAPNLHEADLSMLAAGFVRLVTPLARKQGCAVTLTSHEAVVTRADSARVEQILFNLVFNAVQAGAREIRLIVTTAPTPGITVVDDGPGLPETVRARLFEPFVTTKPAGQGTGLGLAISQRLAKEMGAELVLHPSPEGAGGCAFRLNFPGPMQPPAL